MTVKILHITNSSIKSDFLLSFAKYGDRNKFHYTIACFDNLGDLNLELEKKNIKSFNFKPINKTLFKNIIELTRYIKENKIEIIHAHTFWVGLIAIITSLFTNIKIIYTRHHADYHIVHQKYIHTFIDKLTTKSTSITVAVSNYTKEVMVKYEKTNPNLISVIHNGIDFSYSSSTFYYQNILKNELSIPNENKIVLIISRIHPEKGLDTLISAILVLNNKNITFLIAGQGVNSHYHKKLINEILVKGDRSNIKFLSFRNDIQDLLKISDLVIHPSLSESFGFVYIEAMAMNKLLLCSDIEIIDEIPTKDVAITYEVKNVNELVEGINFSLFEISKLEKDTRINKGYSRFLNNFTAKSMVNKYEKIYEKI